MELSDWIAIGELLVAIIGIIVGIIGGKELKEANNLKFQIGKLETKIEKMKFNNSQVANTINNNGIGLADAEHVAERIVDEKTKDIPTFRFGEGPPDDSIGKDGDIYIQILDK